MPRRRAIKGAEDVEQGRLPDARLADNREALAGREREVDPAQHLDPPFARGERLVETLHAQQLLTHSGAPRPDRGAHPGATGGAWLRGRAPSR